LENGKGGTPYRVLEKTFPPSVTGGYRGRAKERGAEYVGGLNETTVGPRQRKGVEKAEN